MFEMVDPYTSRSAKVACKAATKQKLQRKQQERLLGKYVRVLSRWKIAKFKTTWSKQWHHSWSSEHGRSTQEESGWISTTTLYSISTEWENSNIWDISTQIKCGGANVPEADTYELTNMRWTKIIQHVWLGWYRSRIEFEKSRLPPVICRAPH